MTATIDIAALPARALFDSSVIVGALGYAPKQPTSGISRLLWDAMVSAGREILIAAPSLAEIIRGGSGRAVPHVRGVEVVAFDDTAARLLGTAFPATVLKNHPDRATAGLGVLKYDSMIVACAARHKAQCIVTLDKRQATLAGTIGLKASRPEEFTVRVMKQTSLFDLSPPPKANK